MRNLSIDLNAANKKCVTVYGTPTPAIPTAELAWGLIIGLLRQIAEEDRATRLGTWQHTVRIGVAGKTLGIAGLGKLGSRLVCVGLAFGMEDVAWSQTLTEEGCKEIGVSLVMKEELLARSDVLSIHLVLSDPPVGWLVPRSWHG